MNFFSDIFEDKKDKIVFLVGCFSSFYVSLVGRVYVGELIIFFLYLAYRETLAPLPSALKKLINLMWLWLISAVITDLYRNTPPIDMIKGCVSQLFLISLVPFAYWALNDKLSRFFVFFLGTIVSSQLTYYFLTAQSEFGSTDIWRTYSYRPLFAGLAVFLYWRGNHKLSYIVLVGSGLWMLFGGSRNAFLTNMLTFVTLFAINNNNQRGIIDSISVYQNKISKLVIALTIGLFVIDNAYESLASSGTLGEEAYVKYQKQKNNEVGLASGRLEAIMDIDLISRSPIIGYGSHAKDRENYVFNYYIKHNIEFNPHMFDRDIDSVENMLPRHSRIFGMWMWHGIGAGIFWIYIMFLFFKTFRNGSILLEPQLLGLSVYMIFTELWNNFFSIMSDRIAPIFLWVFLILINDKYKNELYTYE